MSSMETAPHPTLGVRFHPSDKEKITYLLHKVSGGPSSECPLDFVPIPTVHLYGNQEPWKFFRTSWPLEKHFFSKLEKVRVKLHRDHPGRRNPRRAIGQGEWVSIGPTLVIGDSRSMHIGFLKNFVYRSKINAGQDGKWFLKEYSLADAFAEYCINDEYDGYVFCTVVNNSEGYVPDEEHTIEGYFDHMIICEKGRDGRSSKGSSKTAC